jgi:hypothetical protein
MALSRVWEGSLLKRRKLAGTGLPGLGAMSTTFRPPDLRDYVLTSVFAEAPLGAIDFR